MAEPHVLIVDDDRLNFTLLRAALGPGYRTSVASSGMEAIEIASADPQPDLILLDVMMPDMDGYETCRRLKADEGTRDIPIIFVTALTGAAEEIKGIQLGAVDFITKPINVSIVKVRVKTHIELKRHRDELQEGKAFLDRVMDTVATGGVVVDGTDCTIMRINRIGAEMIGGDKQDLIGRDCRDFFPLIEESGGFGPDPDQGIHTSDCLLKTAAGRQIHVRQSCGRIDLNNRPCYLISFLDISDIKLLLEKQVLGIRKAKKILDLVNNRCPRYVALQDRLDLFCRADCMPCRLEGGDHVFVRVVNPSLTDGSAKTVVSLKDQSGHEVEAILRSIYTDILHNALIDTQAAASPQTHAEQLNDRLCRGDIFSDEDFLTAIMGEIDHASLNFRFVSAGHPPFFLIRGSSVRHLPAVDEKQPATNLPMAFMGGIRFAAGEVRLKAGDRLIFYSDGLSEMPVRHGGRMLTTERMKRLLEKLLAENPAMPVSLLSRKLLGQVAAMSGEEVTPGIKNSSEDDVTLLCLEVEDRSQYREQRFTPRNRAHLSRCKRRLYKKLRRRWNTYGYDAPETRLQAVLEEALLNAWKHGNAADPRKAVTVRWRFGNDFHLEVLDEGEGFDFRKSPDPCAPENCENARGRGLFLVRYYADDVKWRAEGACLSVRFHKNGRPGLSSGKESPPFPYRREPGAPPAHPSETAGPTAFAYLSNSPGGKVPPDVPGQPSRSRYHPETYPHPRAPRTIGCGNPVALKKNHCTG